MIRFIHKIIFIILLFLNSINSFGISEKDFFNAVSDGEEVKVKGFILSGGNINARNIEGCAALMFVRSPEMINLLIEAKAVINASDNYGKTVLMYLIDSLLYKKDAIKILINAKPDLNARDENSATALFYCIKNDDLESAKLLINSKANLNLVDKRGKTALIDAIIYTRIDIAKLLIISNANVNIKNIEGKTALMYAVRNNRNIEIIKLLIAAKADVNAIDNEGNSVLKNALFGSGSSDEIIQLLKKAGVIEKL